MKSLKKQLIVWLLGLLTLVGLITGGFSYWLAQNQVSSLLDHQLRLVGESIDDGSKLPDMLRKYAGESALERKSDFVIQVWHGKNMQASHPDFVLAAAKKTGYSDLFLGGDKWRAYTIVYPDRTVQVSQSDRVRRDIATDSALRAIFPIAVLLPMIWMLVVIGVNRIMRPLARVGEAAMQRDAESLAPLPLDHVPAEVAPLIGEINSLLGRIRETLESQRHFMLDAAHELRTPLAALQLQIENLSHSHSREDMDERIAELKSGITRASHLVGQLLKMARYESEKITVRAGVDLAELVKECIGDFIPIAERRGIDLGMTHCEAASIWANSGDLRILFHNLIDNAIRYTPGQGQIDVSVIVSGTRAVVRILDSGPGIAETLLPRVFDRFFRVAPHETEGSGVGLAIVKAIAARESASVELSNRQDRDGLKAEVILNCYLPA
ncbi:MAG TPA: ATP-binding protein [Gallionella sp.]|nr:ATP-binding protein [Gallionella sp.]